MPQTPNRQSLIPPYLDSDAWTQLIEATDAVLKEKIDNPTVWLGQQRNLWILKDETEEKISGLNLVADVDFEIPEKEMLIRQVNMLGFDFKEADLISAEDYQRIVRNLGLFWYGKGKPDFIDFISFVLNSVIKITNLWSTPGATYDSYGPLVAEGDPSIGIPVWEGGEWFPTTHFIASFDPFRFGPVRVSKLVALLYSIANYNLVLDRVELDGSAYIHSVDEVEIARILCAYPLFQIDMIIETNETLGI